MDLGGGSNEDDLTVKLQEIIDVNASVKAALDNGANVKMIMENWDFLQVSFLYFFFQSRLFWRRRPSPLRCTLTRVLKTVELQSESGG